MSQKKGAEDVRAAGVTRPPRDAYDADDIMDFDAFDAYDTYGYDHDTYECW